MLKVIHINIVIEKKEDLGRHPCHRPRPHPRLRFHLFHRLSHPLRWEHHPPEGKTDR